jgi:dolichyl-phosphate-mannose-protein mannosyltransferase
MRHALTQHAARSTHRPAARLTTLVALAFLVRLPLLFTPGYDVRDYKVWARVVRESGIGGAYSVEYPSGTPWLNYPPVYLYVLRATGWLYHALRPDGDWHGQLLAFLLKLSPVLAELVLGVVLYWFLRWRVTSRLALAWAAVYLLNPAIIWNTAYWGGIDAFHSLFLTGALLTTATERRAWAWPLATLAVGAKLLAVPGALAVLTPLLRSGTRRLVLVAALGAVLTGVLLAAPVIVQGELGAMVRAMFRNLGSQALVSVNAHNFWWLVTWGDGWRPDTLAVLPGVSYRFAGLLLFAVVAACTMVRMWPKSSDIVIVCATGGFLTYAFFLFTTEVHENWSLGMFGPLLVAAALRPAYRPLYAALTCTTLANLALQDPPIRDALGDGFYGTLQNLSVLNAAAGCLIFCWWAGLLFGAAETPGRSGRSKSDNPTTPPVRLLP